MKENASVLVVDDNALIISLIRFALRDLPVYVAGAANGSRAFTQAQEHALALLIVDLVMPGMSGTELIKQVRRLPAYATTPIIAISGHEEHSSAKEAQAAGATLFLPKPFTAHDMASWVSRLLLLSTRDSPGPAGAGRPFPNHHGGNS